MASITIEHRTDRPNKMGLSKLRIVMQQDGKKVMIPLNIAVAKVDWDKDKQRVKSSHSQANRLNQLISLRIADLQARISEDELMNGSVSLEKVAGRKVKKTSFYRFAVESLFGWENKKSKGTLRTYNSMLAKVNEFDDKIAVEDITPDWLARYEAWCWTQCKDGGTLKRISFISVILKEAIRRGLITMDPFIIYKKPPKKNPPKIWLTSEELVRVEKVAQETASDPLRNTTYWFLLACYTGLRYSDIEKFSPDEYIQEGRLVLYTQKTGEVVSIKITKKIGQLIEMTKSIPPVYSNQKSNDYLKALAHVAKINKRLTFHTGRHTFAVQCANRGIGQEVTAKLLGHSDLKTTSIYYKITNLRVDKEMEKWEE